MSLPDFDEALRQERLARERLDVDLVRVIGHSAAAWDASDAAEEAGADPAALRDLRLRLLQFAIVDWLPRAALHAAKVHDARERAEWYRGIAGALRSAAGWYERARTAGIIDSAAPMPIVMSAWDEEIQRYERAAIAVHAS